MAEESSGCLATIVAVTVAGVLGYLLYLLFGPLRAPEGPAGTVRSTYTMRDCGGTASSCHTGYRIVVRPYGGGEPVVVRAYESQADACRSGEIYPDCLPKER